MRIRVLTLLAFLICATVDAGVDRTEAQSAFDAFQRNCSRDNGALWGVSLCGNIVLVDKSTRDAIGNDGWSGKLPDGIGIANTAFDWKGARWSMVMLPLPKDDAARDRLLLHERFHAIQAGIGLPASPPAANAYLDSLEGRYLMRLEMRALRGAVLALSKSRRAAREPLADALAFRETRFERFDEAADSEGALDRNEGLAEYTAVRLFTTDRALMLKRAAEGLSEGEKSTAFGRSHAYATGPAWGLLLDELHPDWRREIAGQKSFEQLLARESDGRTITFERRAKRYDGPSVMAEERMLDGERRVRVASYVQRFIDGPVLNLPLHNMNMQMDPYDVHPFENHGTVYEHITVSDDWGTIVVERGALIGSDFTRLTVVAPTGRSGASSSWNLTLGPGWRIGPGTRAGDFVVERSQ